MGKKIFSASFPGIEVRVVEQKRLPKCRPEFRCFYQPNFKRVTIRILPNHLYVDEQIMFIDLVTPTERWNVVVKESDAGQLIALSPGEVISSITHKCECVNGVDYDKILITLRPLDGFIRSYFVGFKHNDLKVMIPIHQ